MPTCFHCGQDIEGETAVKLVGTVELESSELFDLGAIYWHKRCANSLHISMWAAELALRDAGDAVVPLTPPNGSSGKGQP